MLKGFDKLRKELNQFEENREGLIRLSREIIRLSKLIIYSVHRGEFKEADGFVKDIKKLIKELPESSYDTDMRKVALQEYVEAICYYEFIKNNKIVDKDELGVDSESYLLGLCDLTGELVRKAVDYVIKKDVKGVYKIRELVDEVYGEFLKFNLRNSELRKKSDSIKWNLKKIEDIILEIRD